MNLSVSNIAWPADLDNELLPILPELGFSGLEIAPTRIFSVNPYEHLSEAQNFAAEMQTRFGLSISSIQSIWYGRTECIWGADEERMSLIEYTMEAVDFAVSLGCGNLVFGCPRNRAMPENRSAYDAIDFFQEICAHNKNVVIALEPNPVIYDTNFINTTAEAFDFVSKVNRPGLRVNVDFGTIIYNNESLQTLTDNMKLIHHVHISEPGLELIRERPLHKELIKILRVGNYEGFVSIEMKRQECIETLKKTMEYISGVFG